MSQLTLEAQKAYKHRCYLDSVELGVLVVPSEGLMVNLGEKE